jgi:hypothetical protein
MHDEEVEHDVLSYIHTFCIWGGGVAMEICEAPDLDLLALADTVSNDPN